MDTYEAAFIPGLLQIEAYMEALFEAEPSLTTAASTEAIKMKLMRQDWVFNRPRGKLAKMRFILDEACLLRIKNAPYYGQQTQRLRELSRFDSVEISVLPIDRGIHPAMPGAFKLLSFAGPYSPELLYMESVYGGRYIDERRAVSRAREVFSHTLTYVVCVEEYLSNVE